MPKAARPRGLTATSGSYPEAPTLPLWGGAARVGEGEEGPEEAEARLRAMLKASGVKKIGHREALLRAFRELPQAD